MHPAIPAGAGLRQAYRTLLRRPNVVGCYVGRKVVAGRPTSELSVVACVNEKLPAAELAPAERVPTVLEWYPTSRSRVWVPTDVQTVGRGRMQRTPVAGPGDFSPYAGGSEPFCTVGVALDHRKYGPVLTTAGHAVQTRPGTVEYGNAGPALHLWNAGQGGSFRGQVLKSAITDSADYALVRAPAGVRVANLYQDVYTIAGWHQPDQRDVDTRVFVLSSSGFRETRLLGVKAWLEIEGWPMRDIALTPLVTQGGDSGCALVDSSHHVWGLLVGYVPVGNVACSVFASIHHTLSAENAELR
jgi:hypothetical protein